MSQKAPCIKCVKCNYFLNSMKLWNHEERTKIKEKCEKKVAITIFGRKNAKERRTTPKKRFQIPIFHRICAREAQGAFSQQSLIVMGFLI